MIMSIENTVDRFKSVDKLVAVAGDWHMSAIGAQMAIEKIAENSSANIILHLGNFGLGNTKAGKNYLERIQKALVEQNKVLFVTLGNHENYDYLEHFYPVPGMNGCVFDPEQDRIVYLGRGFTWLWNDKRFMSFGGANSINFDALVPGISWWDQEMVSDDDVDKAVAKNSVDVMITHESPWGSNVSLDHLVSFSDAMKDYAKESRLQLRRVTDVLRPELLFHGHYHQFYDAVEPYVTRDNDSEIFYETCTVCLDKEFCPANTAVLYLDDLNFDVL